MRGLYDLLFPGAEFLKIGGMRDMSTQNVFEILDAINVNDYTEVKDTGKAKLTYLSWSKAWEEVKKRFPEATYYCNHRGYFP